MGKNDIGSRFQTESARQDREIYKKQIAALGKEAEHRGEKYLAQHPEVIVRDEEKALGLRGEGLRIAENRPGRPSESVMPGVRRRNKPTQSPSVEA